MQGPVVFRWGMEFHRLCRLPRRSRAQGTLLEEDGLVRWPTVVPRLCRLLRQYKTQGTTQEAMQGTAQGTMAEAEGLAPWVTVLTRLCPLRHRSSSGQEATRVPQDEDVLARWLALVRKVYCHRRRPRARVTLNQAALELQKV
jgi:hypothetical protein